MFWYRFTRFDRMLMAGAAIILMASSVLLLDDRWLFKLLSSSQENLTPIGLVKTSVNDVRQRHGTAFSWLPLEEKKPVFQGDSIFTGAGSEALIITDRGEQISISQNSLIVINAQPDSIRLDINYGSVLGQVGKDKKLLIASGGDVTEFKGDDAVVKVDVGSDKNLVVNVLEGQVEVTSEEGRRLLGPQQQAEISGEGSIVDPTEIQLELLSPVPDRVLKPDEIQDLILTWRSSHPFTEYKIEIAEDPDFKKVVITDNTPRPLFRPPTLPTNTRLFWRVSGRLGPNQPQAKSPTNAFTVAQDIPPLVAFPMDRARFTFEEQPNDESPRLTVVSRWIPKSAATKWQVQLATTPDFSTGVRALEVEETSANLGALSEGNYYLRIRARDWSDALWSDTQSFAISRRPPASLKPPQIVTGDEVFFLTTKATGVNQETLFALKPEQVSQYVEAIPELAWNAIPGAVTYDLEIATDEEFTRIIHRAQIPQTRYGWESVRLGEFFWRIRSVSMGNQRGSFATPQTLTVQLAPPRNLTDEKVVEEVTVLTQMESPPAPFLLRWSPTLFTARYELEFDKNANFAKPLRLLTPFPFKKVQAPQAGIYFWRVRAIDTTNRALTEWSEAFKYDYSRVYLSPETTKELRALYPNNETIMMIGQGSLKINFRWVTPIKNSRYRFQMSEKADFSTTRKDFLTTKEFFLLQERLPGGWYYWRLRVESPQFTSPWTTAYQFQIKYEQTPFNFERSERIQEKELKKAEVVRQKEMAVQAKLRAEESRKQMAELMVPLDAPTDLAGPEAFVIEAVAIPANVKNLERLPVAQIARFVRSQPVWEWHPVTNANEYMVEVAEDALFTKKVDSFRTHLTNARWSNLRPGKFYWRVTAFGRVARPSPPSEAADIEFNLNRPQLLTPHSLLLLPNAKRTIPLKWTPVLFARSYEVQWGMDKNFLKTETVKVATHFHSAPANDKGYFYWRVRAMDEKNQPLTDYSHPRIVNFNLIERLPAQATRPILLYPPDKARLKVPIEEGPRLGFFWQALPPVGLFVIEVAKDKKFIEIVSRTNTKLNDLIVDHPVTDGTFYWRLSVISQTKTLWQSPVQQFTLSSESLRQPAGK